MSDTTTRMKVNYMGNMRTVFNDSNYIHWAAADFCRNSAPVGIEVPLATAQAAGQRSPRARDFFIEPLTHSVPYLVPEAADAIHEIGRRFTDSVCGPRRLALLYPHHERDPHSRDGTPPASPQCQCCRLRRCINSPPLSMCHMPASFLMPTTQWPVR